MAVNETIYGASNQWYNSSFQQSALTKKNKVAYFGANIIDRTLEKGVEAGKLSYNSGIDKSLSYCGLGSECALSHLIYATNDNGAAALIDRQDKEITNFAFFEKSSSAEFDPLTVYNFSDLRYIAWSGSLGENRYQFNRYLAPLTKIIPENVVLAVKVYAAKNDYSDISVFDFNTYLSSHNTYPKIISVYVDAYIGNYTENIIPRETLGGVPFGSYYIPFHLGLLDEFNIPTKNVNFFAYDFYYMPVFGNFSNSHLINNNNDFMPIAFTENSYPHIKCEKVNNNYYAYTEYYPEFEQDILKTVACFGLYFTGNSQVAAYGNLTHEDMYIGILGGDGIGHGEYLRGAETTNAPQNTWSDMSNSGYDYKTTDNSKYINGTNFNLWDFSLNTINKFYVLSETQVEQLSTELYTIMSSVSSDMPIDRYNQTVFLTQNPIDCIVSIKRFPVDVPYIGTSTPLKLGSQTTSISAHYLLKPCNVYYFVFSNSSDTGLYQTFGGSFLDFEPYTKVSINVPFCGSFDVPCNYFHKYGGVNVALLIDFVTGACTAFLMVNGNVVDSIQGECGVNVPLSGLQTATIDSQIFNASMSKQKQDNNFALSMLGGAAAIALGVATGGAAAVVGGAAAMTGSVLNKSINDKTIDYDLQHMQAPIKQVSSASPVIARANDMRCKMIISRPEYMNNYNEEVYAKTIGYACLLNGYVSNFHGLTYGEIDLTGVNCSESEKEMIKSAFASGVYLP